MAKAKKANIQMALTIAQALGNLKHRPTPTNAKVVALAARSPKVLEKNYKRAVTAIESADGNEYNFTLRS